MFEDEPALARGADGWRGVLTEGFTVDSACDLAHSMAAVLIGNLGASSILVTHDSRILSNETAEAVADVIAGYGMNVALISHLPTPVASYAVRASHFDAAILVTASHNPFYWNGIKLKIKPGRPPDRAVEEAIERQRADGKLVHRRAGRARKQQNENLIQQYVSETLVRFGSTEAGGAPTIVLDGFHGIGTRTFAAVLRAVGCRVSILDDSISPIFGGLIPDPTLPQSRVRLAEAIVGARADVGLLCDGDGDRLGVMDSAGYFVSSSDVLALLVLALADANPTGQVVVTSPTSSIVERVARARGWRAMEAPVGFKHLAGFLGDGTATLAGGISGDIGVSGYGFDRDPFTAALLLLAYVRQTKKTIRELVDGLHEEYGRSHFREWKILPSPLQSSVEQIGRKILCGAGLDGVRACVTCVDGPKLHFEGGWLLLRPATTERGLRLYAEALDERILEYLHNASLRML